VKVNILFSKHSLEKLKDATSQKLGITKDSIIDVLKSPEVIDSSEYPILTAIKKFKRNLSLCVIYKFIGKDIKVITFFPARRGRYESKILHRR